MTGEQWDRLLRVMDGEIFEPPPVGFIIDSPWLPGWAGIDTLDYYGSDEPWLETNLKAVETFPKVIFLPGFWAEYGMCTEPSAFGSKCSWRLDGFPDAHRVFGDIAEAAAAEKPDVAADGLLPFVLARLRRCRGRIERAGHSIKFAVSRGPLNIASFLVGATEFLTAIRTDPQQACSLLETLTQFVVDWIGLQIRTFDTIEGIFILDDITGFLGREDFEHSALPYLSKIFGSFDLSVKFFHNDAKGLVCAPYLEGMGVNLFNFSSDHTVGQMRAGTGPNVTLLGGIPPRDVMASGAPEDVSRCTGELLKSASNEKRFIPSCGGGMPPGVSSENIRAFISAVHLACRLR